MPFPQSNTSYCTVGEAQLGGAAGDAGTLSILVGDASRIIDGYCWTTFDPAAFQAITGLTLTGLVATAMVASTANMAVGQPIYVTGLLGFTVAPPVGAYTVTAIVDATHFTYTLTTAPTGAWTSGGTVTTQQTVTVSDVRRPIVKLPTPFSNITSLTLNGGNLDPTSYIVEEWGVRLYSLNPLNNGWPIRGSGDMGTWPAAASGGPYGSQVTVTATFGYNTIPRLVAIACRKLTRKLAVNDGPYERGQTKLTVGSYDIMFNPKDPHPLDSTGDAEVDLLLQPFKRTAVMVA